VLAIPTGLGRFVEVTPTSGLRGQLGREPVGRDVTHARGAVVDLLLLGAPSRGFNGVARPPRARNRFASGFSAASLAVLCSAENRCLVTRNPDCESGGPNVAGPKARG
jgi:hypothetical protein